MDDKAKTGRSTLFGPLPAYGVWTALSLTRNQFLLILFLSIALFLFIDGPLWTHLHDTHFSRIVLSYAVIPVAVAAALYRNGKARLPTILVASAVMCLIKLVLTAGLLVLIGVSQA